MRSNRHITFFFPTFTPGGIERVMLTLTRTFLTRGIKVDILVADRKGPLEGQVPDKARIIDLEAGRVACSLFPLRKYLRREAPDALISGHTHANVVCVWASIISRTDVTTIVGVHTTESTKRRRGLRERIVHWSLPMSYRLADRIIAVSNGAAEDISAVTGLSKDHIKVIHNPIPQKYSTCSPDVHPWIRNENLSVILGAGRLSSAKDFSTLIRSFKLVHDENQDFRLIILGEGDYRTRLNNEISRLDLSQFVDLPGFVDNPMPYMEGADVFVLSSRREGFGLVLVESMAVGTPVVSTNCPTGPAEILANGGYGELVPVGDSIKMADSILETVENPVDPDELQKRANEFNPDTAADKYLTAIYGD